MDNSNKPDLRAYVGATGSGKGVSIREHIESERSDRRVFWDPLGEYGKYGVTVSTIPALCAELKKKKFGVCFYPGPDLDKFGPKFALFCRAVFAAGDCFVHIEELSDVTKPSYAPPPWRRITKQGRHQGLRVCAGTQRPADCDKAFLSGTTYVRVFTMRWKKDKEIMAELLEIPYAEVAALTTIEKDDGTTVINCYERDFRSGARGQKTITLKRKK